MSLIVSNCGSFPAAEPIARDLPEAPKFAKPVVVPEPRAGEDQLAIAARERAGRKRDASTIRRFLDWYFDVRKEYGAK